MIETVTVMPEERIVSIGTLISLISDGNPLCQADPFKRGIDVLQQITSRGILRVPDSPCDAVYFTFDWRRSA
jgi:hypothetical protein